MPRILESCIVTNTGYWKKIPLHHSSFLAGLAPFTELCYHPLWILCSGCRLPDPKSPYGSTYCNFSVSFKTLLHSTQFSSRLLSGISRHWLKEVVASLQLQVLSKVQWEFSALKPRPLSPFGWWCDAGKCHSESHLLPAESSVKLAFWVGNYFYNKDGEN